VEMVRPPKIIATNTVNSIQAGLFFGYTAMVDGLVAQMKAEAGEEPPVIATGGLSAVIASGSSAIDRVDPLLAMKGLRILYERNR
ncbi:MAG: pantothenate kinase, partial [Deltaproteobacteria bacterium]|nr:pantothenate kinase [Deltaproteobacteria bacterium]